MAGCPRGPESWEATMLIRVLLVDDHALFRACVRALLQTEPEIVVVGEAGTGEEACELAGKLVPDVVLMDLSMPGEGGLAAIRRISKAVPSAHTLALTMHAEAEHLLAVLDAGGSGYVSKQSADSELIEAIRLVARGEAFLYPSGLRILAQRIRTAPTASRLDPLHKLSTREREVMGLTASGFSSTEIGDRLQLSHKTVETYRQRLMQKLGLHHRSELMRLALRNGLLA
jgi:DNA-binding NarL/FixJ family response regulator